MSGLHRAETRYRATALAALLVTVMAGAVAWAVAPTADAETGLSPLEVAQGNKANCEILLARATSSAQRTRARNCITDQQVIITALSTPPAPSVSPSQPPSPSPSVTPPPSPTPSPSPTAGPSPTPPTGPLTNCFTQLAACGYVHAGNTGVPAGTTLTPMAATTITTAGTVVDGRLVNGTLVVRAPGVIIRNSKIVNGDDVYGVTVEGAGSATIEDSEIDCVGHSGTGVDGDNYTARRLHIHGCENGFHTGSFTATNILIEDNYVTDLGEVNAGHSDGIQGDSGSGITVRHNTFDLLNPITSSIIWDNLTVSNALIENNFFAAGAFTIYCPTGGTGITYRGNRFYGPVGNWQTDPHRPAYGFTTGCARPGITWTNNYRDDTGGTVSP